MTSGRSKAKSLIREAATLVLVARNKQLHGQFDYRTLLLERVAKSSFMPSTYVFPGGVIEKADFSDEWMDLFKESFAKFGMDFSSLINIQGIRPPAMKQSSTSIPSEVAFRICAIRETFEESGVLLLKNLSHGTQSYVEKDDIQTWREDIHNDASKFVTMCKKFCCIPDVWSLGEWSNWLTPASLAKRFDTLFFICFINDEPAVCFDEKEITQAKWMTPAEGIVKHSTRQLKVGMPQLYEMLRFCRFTKWADLKAFQDSRASDGCEQWLPIILKCADGVMSVLPHDDLYRPLYDRVEQELSTSDTGQVATFECTESIEQLKSNSKNLHRVSGKPLCLHCNVKLGHGQCSLVTDVQRIMDLARELQSNL